MIEKFNFYDVYGYFLPGFALISLLYLPFGLMRGHWPAATVTDGVSAAIIAYLAGHILQAVAHHVVPSTVKDSHGQKRYPSDVLLDTDDKSFSPTFKRDLEKRVETAFQIRLALQDATLHPQEADSLHRQRQDAFFLCRDALVAAKVMAYPEQFEGMYSMMRGLASAFFVACLYLLGWSLPGILPPPAPPLKFAIAVGFAILILMATAAAAIIWHASTGRQAAYFSVAVFLTAADFIAGCLFSWQPRVSAAHLVIFWISLGCLLCAVLCLTAYRYFANEFAKAVWRGFAGYQSCSASCSCKTSSGGKT